MNHVLPILQLHLLIEISTKGDTFFMEVSTP